MALSWLKINVEESRPLWAVPPRAGGEKARKQHSSIASASVLASRLLPFYCGFSGCCTANFTIKWIHFFPSFFRSLSLQEKPQQFPTDLEVIGEVRSAGQQAPGILLSLYPRSKYNKSGPSGLALYMGPWGQNSGPHSCEPSALPTELSPQLLMFNISRHKINIHWLSHKVL